MIKLSAIIAVVFVLQFVHIKSARILAVYPTPSISHQVVFRSLTDELIKHGHEITVVTTDPKYPRGQSPKNLTEIDMHDVSYGIWKDILSRVKSADDEDAALEILFRGTSQVFKALLNTQEFQDIIEKKKGEYDLLMLEAYLKPTLVLSEIFKVPVILVSSFGAVNENFRAIGVPTHPLIYPSPTQRKIYNLTNLEKLQQWYASWKMENMFSTIEIEDDQMLKSRFGPEIPCIHELMNNIDLLMINIHPIWLENQPVPPNTIYIGGLHLKPPQDLPKDLQSYLDASKNGVIYFSFGTNALPELLPPEKIQMFVNVFSKLPYDVLWKWNLDTLPGKSENVKISKWFPQADLLRHPKVKLFITQGGVQSTDEAISAGVPMIGIPMISDQWYNVQKYVRHGIGVQLDITTLTENEFKDAIETVINDKSYRENINRLRNVIEDQPMTPAERAVWWVEHIIRHGGGKHLRAAGANMTSRQYFELDLVFIVLSVILSILAIGLIIIYSLYEAISAGVPMIGIPMISDQWYNVQKYVRHGIGVQLDITTLTENEFKDAIETVINDKSYRENINRLRNVIEDQPMTPAERAVWWVEHIIRHGGGKHLRAAGANMTSRQYFELDLVFIVLSVILSILAIGLIIIYSLCKYVIKNFRTNIKIKRS